jgi:hypothetical protein
MKSGQKMQFYYLMKINIIARSGQVHYVYNGKLQGIKIYIVSFQNTLL